MKPRIAGVMSWPLVLLALTAAIACRDAGRASSGGTATRPSARETTSTQPTTFTGTLQGDVAAIGGERTGWRLVGDGATGGFDVDISKVRDRARQLDGKRVAATGRMTTKDWPERGRTQVLVADRIEPAPQPGR